MAGEGSRFKSEGYDVPKPLIQIDGVPMVIRASQALPDADTWIYMVRKEHMDTSSIGDVLKDYDSDVKIIPVDSLTDGQASTCLLAKDLIDNNQQLMIGACDNGAIWNKELFEKLKEGADCLVWTFRNNVAVKRKPEAYGWVNVDDVNVVKNMSVKVPISNTPMNDHAVVGTFWFKKGSMFVDAAERMIQLDRRINNEFYVDECINDMVALGYVVKVFEIDKYICWGTPNDLRTYEYWKEFFTKYDSHLNKNNNA